MEEPRIDIQLVEQGSRKRSIIILVIIAAVAVIAFLLVNEFLLQAPVVEEQPTEAEGEEVVNNEYDYSVSYPEGWTMERESFPENRNFNAEEVYEKITTCGVKCAVADIVTFRKETHSFKIYVFSNSTELGLLDFLEVALNKARDELLFFIEEGDIATVRESLDFEDGRRVRNLYFAKPSRKDLVYWSSQDYLIDNDEEFAAIVEEVALILRTFEL